VFAERDVDFHDPPPTRPAAPIIVVEWSTEETACGSLNLRFAGCSTQLDILD
jgi:hypothetical protein